MKKKNNEKKRGFIQFAAAALLNGYAIGYQKGAIFTGKSKMFCVPVLNCYSCPGALGSCPIGSLQSILSGYQHKIPFYVLGTLMLFGIFLGRVLCGFLCPFGWLQDLLHKIPVKKIRVPAGPDSVLRYMKYAVLIFLVLLFPFLIRDEFGFGTTWFCKYICPAGTLEAGVPLIAQNESLRQSLGDLFQWKFAILAVIILLSLTIYRPFCKYLCPLGAFYALFNRFSLYRLTIEKGRCVDCKACEKACRMNVKVTQNINSPECIRCGACIDACPQNCIRKEALLPKSKSEKASS